MTFFQKIMEVRGENVRTFQEIKDCAQVDKLNNWHNYFKAFQITYFKSNSSSDLALEVESMST
jgi:hypothetical protein